MNKLKKKILFFGLGSIGLRHLNLLNKNFNHSIYAYRTKKSNLIPDVTNLFDINEALQINPDIAFITNPTHLHIETALTCLDAGIKYIFIEKPLSNSLKNIDLLLKKAEEIKALIYVSYQMRYNPVLKRLKEIVEERKNQIFYSETRCCSYLPHWRPNMDYRSSYSSKKSEGGGVILDISHEFDYNQYLFGKIESISGIYGKISTLEINSEDFCDVYVKFKRDMLAKIHLDYFSHNDERIIKILTPKEEITANLLNNEITIKDEREMKKEIFNFKLNDVYEEQIRHFLNCVENDVNEMNNIEEAKDLLEKMLEFKKNNKMIHFPNI